MRISDTIRYGRALRSIQSGQRDVADLQVQIGSGKRVQKPSDDPNAASGVMAARAAGRGILQFRRNITSGLSRLETEESVLNQLTDALARAQELAVGQGSDISTPETMSITRFEVDNILDFAVTLGNTKWNEEFVFGGAKGDQPPFDAAAPLVPLTPLADLAQQHVIVAAAGQQVRTNHNGKEIFLDSGVLQALSDLSNALGAADTNAVRVSLGSLKAASAGVQTLLGDLGGRYNHLEVTDRNLAVVQTSTLKLRSDLEDADLAEAMVHLTAKQTALQGAMLATSRIMSLSLADYL